MPSQKYATLMGLLGKGFDSGADGAIKAINQKSDNDAKLEQLLKGITAKSEAEMHQNDVGMDKAVELKNRLEASGKGGHKYNINLSGNGGVGISEASPDPMTSLMRQMAMQNTEEERSRHALQDLADRTEKTGTAQVQQTLQRTDRAIPGGIGGVDDKGQPVNNFKSVGGWKNAVPDFAVSTLEKLHALPQGAGDERSALNDLTNTKIYDSSGKQLNEAETGRIKSGMGLGAVFQDPKTIREAINQFGNTAYQKNQDVTAGARPRDVATFKARGGHAGYSSLADMLGRVPPTQQPPAQPPVGPPGASGSANAGQNMQPPAQPQYEPDVIAYAQKFKMPLEQAAAIKKLRPPKPQVQ